MLNKRECLFFYIFLKIQNFFFITMYFGVQNDLPQGFFQYQHLVHITVLAVVPFGHLHIGQFKQWVASLRLHPTLKLLVVFFFCFFSPPQGQHPQPQHTQLALLTALVLLTILIYFQISRLFQS